VRVRNILCAAAVLALTGCANQTAVSPGAPAPAAPAPATTPAWVEPSAYQFTLTSSCGERALIGKYQVTVTAGLVTKNVGLDDAAKRSLMLRLARLVPTLGQLKAEADTATKEGADKVTVVVDPADGHPTSISIDPRANAIDDESCYTISDYSVG
jgi:hypothetical protein